MSKIQITFYPDVKKEDLDTGVMVETSWQRLSDTLDKYFQVRENERLVGITVTESGIKGKIETIK